MLAAFRVLLQLVRRDLRTSASLAMNNLFFLVVFLLQGSNPRTMMWTAFPFVVLLGLPLLLAFSGDPLQRIPVVRLALWPLTSRDRGLLHLFGLVLTPAVWVAIFLLLLRAGLGMAVLFFVVMLATQMVVAGIGYVLRRIPIFQIQRYVPQPPGRLGGIFRLSLRQIMTTLDFYVALMVSVSGVLYRLVNSHADRTAFPIVAVLVALALSTYAQRMFGLDGVAGETRYRLLPLRGWQLLLAKDAAYLGVLLVLVLPLGVLPGLAFGLMALTVGRNASLTSSGMQLRWRFVGGDILVGIPQVAIGVAVSFGCLRFGVVMFAGAVAVYVASLVVGGRLWERNPGRISAAAKRARRRRLAKGW